MLNNKIAAALSLLSVLMFSGCATNANQADDTQDAYEEPEYTTGSNIPHKGAAVKIDPNSPEGRAMLDNRKAMPSITSTGGH
ncbi:MAG: hypothetical protein JO142_11705 [Burkholderiales bacterium]|nr:hypothetical protein [Burkholderiales bacterium]